MFVQWKGLFTRSLTVPRPRIDNIGLARMVEMPWERRWLMWCREWWREWLMQVMAFVMAVDWQIIVRHFSQFAYNRKDKYFPVWQHKEDKTKEKEELL